MSYSEISTTMKVGPWAAKLRKRIVVLQAKQRKAMAAYKVALDKWRRDVSKWLKTADAQYLVPEEERWDGRGMRINVLSKFWEGAPLPPKKPADKRVQEIRNMLRHLALTGQTTVRVDTAMVTRFFSDESEDE